MFYDEEAMSGAWFLNYFLNIFQLLKIHNRHGQTVVCELHVVFETLMRLLGKALISFTTGLNVQNLLHGEKSWSR
jgi:hypothetical protein